MTLKNSRILAFLIDNVICSSITSLLIPLKYSLGTYDLGGQRIFINLEFTLLGFAVYFLLFDFFNKGNTAGKAVMGLRTRNFSAQELPLKTRIGRTLLKLVSMIVLPISAIVYLLNGNTLHDNLMKSTVVYKNS